MRIAQPLWMRELRRKHLLVISETDHAPLARARAEACEWPALACCLLLALGGVFLAWTRSKALGSATTSRISPCGPETSRRNRRMRPPIFS